MGIRDRWTPGTLRNLFLMKKEDVCACKRELAVNGLKNPKQRFDNVAILGEGGYGVVRRGRCKITRKQYAIKLTSPVSCGGWKEGRMFQCLALFCIATCKCTPRKLQTIEQMKRHENETLTICGPRLECGSTRTSL